MLINKTVDLIDSIDLFRYYVVVKNLFIAVGFVNKASFFIYISSCIYNYAAGL